MRSIDHMLVSALHDGIFETPLWSSFLPLLSRQSRATFVSLTVEGAGGTPVVHRQAGAQPPPQLEAIYRERYGEGFLPFHRMRDGRVYALEELVDPSDPRHRAFREELVRPWGMAAIRLVRVSLPTGAAAVLCCAGGREVGSAVSAMLAALAPHLRTALRTLLALRQAQLHDAIGDAALGRLGFGWAALDSDCRIVAADRVVEWLVEDGKALRRGHRDRLTLATPRLNRDLVAAVSAQARDGCRGAIAILLDAETRLALLVVPVPAGVEPGESAAIIYVRRRMTESADRSALLVQLFGLLPSEARLACAIADGRSIGEAADLLGISRETARHYSKRIFAKTGAHGQPDLVRLLLTSVAAIA